MGWQAGRVRHATRHAGASTAVCGLESGQAYAVRVCAGNREPDFPAAYMHVRAHPVSMPRSHAPPLVSR